MLKIDLIHIGRTRQSSLVEAEAHYIKQLKSSSKLNLIELPESNSSLQEQARRDKESESLISSIEEGRYLILLDPRGKQLDSPEFAALLQARMNSGQSHIAFAIGGALGWNDAARSRAQFILSLSKMTFPHELTRLILIEQLYRAFSILRGGPYHK